MHFGLESAVDGFCYDGDHNKYLKYNNGYFRVGTDEHQCDYLTRHANGIEEKLFIKQSKEGFFDVDTGFPHSKMRHFFSQAKEDYFIEAEVSEAITKYCVHYDGVADIDEGGGIFKNNDNAVFFH